MQPFDKEVNMAVYTHNFEIKIDGISLEGEICFGVGSTASAFKTNDGEEMTVEQHGLVQEFLEELNRIAIKFPLINKIEITKKP